MEEDFYKILGITDEERKLESSAFKKVLKKKFRELSKKYHPDKAKEEDKAAYEEKYKLISEAYNTLNDDSKRQQYDNRGMGGFDADDDFLREAMNRMRQNFYNPFGETSTEPPQGNDVKVKLHLNINEVFNGCEKTFTINREVPCTHCNGTGSKTGKKEVCPTCQGLGVIRNTIRRGNFVSVQQTTCPTCRGTGERITQPCDHCHGRGMEFVPEEITVSIPRSTFEGTVLVQKGMGSKPKSGGGINGDLYILIIEDEDNVFSHNNEGTVHCFLNLNIKEAFMGTKKEIPTIDGGKILITIPELTPDGTKFAVKGKGFYLSPYGNNRGNMFVEVIYDMPKKLNERQKEILEEFYKLEEEKNKKPSI